MLAETLANTPMGSAPSVRGDPGGDLSRNDRPPEGLLFPSFIQQTLVKPSSTCPASGIVLSAEDTAVDEAQSPPSRSGPSRGCVLSGGDNWVEEITWGDGMERVGGREGQRDSFRRRGRGWWSGQSLKRDDT